MTTRIDLAAVNDMSRDDFVALLGDVFEHSPWVARRAYDARPFTSIAELHEVMVKVVKGSSAGEKINLLRAHPELAGREAQAGALTAASTGEQASVGLNALSRTEFERVAKLNTDYQNRFGFPFIIAVRQNTKERILGEWERRLQHSQEDEIAAALAQVYIIGRLRLDQLEDVPMGKLSTHVLDTANGRPAAGVKIELFRVDGGDHRLLKTSHTNCDGRTDELLLDRDAITVGQFELVFHIGPYFEELGDIASDPPFLDQVPVRFFIADAKANYHVPLVASPWSYSTYRGS